MLQPRYWRVREGFLVGSILAVMVSMVDVGQAPAKTQTTSGRPSPLLVLWSQTLPTETRFVVLANFNSEAVLDQNTGLGARRLERCQVFLSE